MVEERKGIDDKNAVWRAPDEIKSRPEVAGVARENGASSPRGGGRHDFDYESPEDEKLRMAIEETRRHLDRSSGPLRELHDKIHYEEAVWKDDKTMKIGSNVFNKCEEIGGGGHGTIYKAEDSRGRAVVIKVSKEMANLSLLDSYSVKRSQYGEEETLIDIRRDEAALTLLKDERKNNPAIPELIACGRLDDGSHLAVVEYIHGRKADDIYYPVRAAFMPRKQADGGEVTYTRDCVSQVITERDAGTVQSVYSVARANPDVKYTEAIPNLEKPNWWKIGKWAEYKREMKELESKIDMFKTILIMILQDTLRSFASMKKVGINNRDLKMYDYVVDWQTEDELTSAKAIEKSWRGVFVDWGHFEMRIDKPDRPEAAWKNLFAYFLEISLSKAQLDAFNQQPPIPRLVEDLTAIEDDKMRKYLEVVVTSLNKVREPFEKLLLLCKEYQQRPGENFDAECKSCIDSLNKEAARIGLDVKLEYPI